MGSRFGSGAALDSLRETRARSMFTALARRPGGASACEARSARGARAAASPRSVTTGGKSEQAAIVDWLNVTFVHDVGVPDILEALRGLLGDVPVGAEDCRGKHGFEHGLRLKAWVGGQLIAFGFLCWGGEAQRGRMLLSIEGGGCRHIEDWDRAREWIESLPGARITRCDLAVDLHEGEYTVDDCASWYVEGQFGSGGRKPVSDTVGDWLEAHQGRTLYIGRCENGKMLRCYEKGKQLGDLASEWVRFEVQFGHRDREIPFEILTKRDAFFAGAYPALEQVLGVVGDRIRTVRTTSSITCAQVVEHLSRTYGKWIGWFHAQGIEPADLVEAVRVSAAPARLNLASVADAGIAATVHAVFSERCRYAHDSQGSGAGSNAFR